MQYGLDRVRVRVRVRVLVQYGLDRIELRSINLAILLEFPLIGFRITALY